MNRALALSSERLSFARVVLTVWLGRSALGWLLALPLIGIIGASGVSQGLEADRALFEAGGLWLAELVRLTANELTSTSAACWPYLLLAVAVRAVLQGMLLAQMRAPESGPAQSLRAALGELWTLLAIAGCEIVGKGLWIVIIALIAGAIADAGMVHNEAWRSLLPLLVAAIGSLGFGALGIAADVRRAVLFEFREIRGAALRTVLDVVSEHAKLLASGYTLRAGIGALILACVARLVELVDVSQSGAWRVVSVLGLHQAALLSLTLLDALWLRRISACVQPPASRL
ncbi:MAG: hypothetical protein ACOY0T_10835 [Myxococcota bacterium]